MKRRKDTLFYPSVKFLRSSATLKTFTSLQRQDTVSTQQQNQLSGQEAKSFYETVLQEPSSKHTSNQQQNNDIMTVSQQKKRSKTITKSKHENNTKQINKLLRIAQDGDCTGLKRLFEEDTVDINSTDQFGWTALMCASYSGHISCVRLLLEHRANIHMKNKIGETAQNIAKNQDHISIYNLIKKYKKPRKHRFRTVNSVAEGEPIFCDICKLSYTSSKTTHNSSTTHLFNCQHRTDRTMYSIPETNIGFQLMTRTGWDKEKGLGPEGKGRKFPIKTILKQDRYGLGKNRKERAKVTHFKPGDTSAVERKVNVKSRTPKLSSKRKIIEKQLKDKKWEQNMRVYMNTD